MSIAQQRRGVFHWHGDSYRINRGTWSYWSGARLIAYPDTSLPLRLIARDAELITFAGANECVADPKLSEQAACTVCVVALTQKGFTVWSIVDALAHIQASPESGTATALIDALVRWFFLEKLPAALPSHRSET